MLRLRLNKRHSKRENKLKATLAKLKMSSNNDAIAKDSAKRENSKEDSSLDRISKATDKVLKQFIQKETQIA